MNDLNNLILFQNTEIAKDSYEKDILSLFGVPKAFDNIIKYERKKFLSFFNIDDVLLAGGIINEAERFANSQEFVVEIPEKLKDLLKSGEAIFDKSKICAGNFAPNIRIKGQKEIVGQITLKPGTNGDAIVNSISNLVMMAMIQSILAKLDCIEEKIDDIKTGQINDRIGEIIGAFKSFCDLYPSFSSPEELIREANAAYKTIQEGLAKFLLQIEDEWKKLNKFPSNNMEAVFYLLKKLLIPDPMGKCKKCYSDYIYHINLYFRLLYLADIILISKDFESGIKNNHKVITEYIKKYHDDKFIQKMEYSLYRNPGELSSVHELNDILNNRICELPNSKFQIEFSPLKLKN